MKKVGYAMYVHHSSFPELITALHKKNIDTSRIVKVSYEARNILPGFQIIKYNQKNGNISFIKSPDWDTANEPTVGDSICIRKDGKITHRKGGKRVYHNKWQFVSEEYKGFDIEKSKTRTKLWHSIPNIKEKKKYIGMKDYWYKLLMKHNIPI